MTRSELLRSLLAKGFVQADRSDYEGAIRLSHPSVTRGSVFVGDGPGVYWLQQATLVGSGAFLIANGRSGGMTRALTALGVAATGHIPDPDGRRSPDDPYWRGDSELLPLMAAMRRSFRK
jgi:hypothetical protein